VKLLIIDDQKIQYGNFVRKLKNENPDIQIKILPSAVEGLEFFKKYCCDLIILDQFMGGAEKDGTAFLRKLRACSPSKYPEIIFVTNNYDELPTNEILKSEIPITLFIEKDPTFQDTLLVATQLVMRRVDNKVRYDPRDLFGDPFIDLILRESNEIIQKEHAGYYGIDQQRQIATLVRSYVNSLKMRSEWDLDDVLELSIFFAQSLCRVYNLPDDLVKILRRFLNLEDVLYSIPYYRDHFFHQIKVFLLGFCIINSLNRNERIMDTLLSNSDGMKLWFIASMFHDIGYPFEKMTRWLNNFVEGTLRSPGDLEQDSPIIPIEFHWGGLLGKRFHAYHLEQIARRICQLYGKDNPETFAEILSEFTNFVVGRPDHGLYSSLIVQNFLRYRSADSEIDPVSIAIALHNDEVAKLITRVIGPQTFEKDPLSFLLAFCDLAQDWGRIRPVGMNKSGYSKFGYPAYASQDLFDPASNTIRIILRYGRKLSLNEKIDWNETIYRKYIQPTRNCWAVASDGHHLLNFCIEYQMASDSDPVLARLVF
jgi:DNA-binding response OmpR family regulator